MNSGRLQNKRCLITAAGQGIGRASARAMRAAGADVIATDINPDLIESLGRQGFEIFALDVCDKAAITAAAQRIGAVDVLFNCAGYVDHGTILDCDEDDWKFSTTINITAIYRMIRAFLPAMLEAGGGSIINMASVASTVIAAPNRFVYGTTKGAVIGLTRSVAADFIARGIRCNVICPGTIESPSLETRLAATGDYEAARKAFTARQPLGRIGTAEEVAALVVYLASDEASYTTGAVHIIDGGWSNI